MSITSVELEWLLGMAALVPASYPAPGDWGTNALHATPVFNGAKTLRGLSQVPKASWLQVHSCRAAPGHGATVSTGPSVLLWSNHGHYPFPQMDFPEGIAADTGSVWDEIIAENPFCPEPKADHRNPAVGWDIPGAKRQTCCLRAAVGKLSGVQFSFHGYGNR